MSLTAPYTYFSCPCADSPEPSHKRQSLSSAQPAAEDEEANPTFSPHSPRSNYSLFPLDHLLYCEDCHEIRCPRCVIDEIVTWFCPSCLFEVAGHQIKGEGNRCGRSCYNCPICTAPLAVNALDVAEQPGVTEGSYLLSCGYCNWCSTDLGIRFHKPNDITGQLASLRKSGNTRGAEAVSRPGEISPAHYDREQQFKRLKQFCSSQIALEASSVTISGLDLSSTYGSYSSPGSLSRIMSIYTGVGSLSGASARTRDRAKIRPMREAVGEGEGVVLLDETAEEKVISRMLSVGWDELTSQVQRTDLNSHTPFTSEVYPIPTLLRSKRAKRCRTCRHILVKPEPKVQSTRFRIRLVAMNYIPRLTISPFPLQTTSQSFQPPRPSPFPTPPSQLLTLTPLRPTQFLLSFTNPLFTSLSITLAVPPLTSKGTKTTILTPQFLVGASKDIWDEALSTSTGAAIEETRKRAPAPSSTSNGGEEGGPYARGRNWTSVVVEVVPGREEVEGEVLEIPIFVRVEDEGDNTTTGGEKSKDGGAEGDTATEKKTDAFWCVLGVGDVRHATQ